MGGVTKKYVNGGLDNALWSTVTGGNTAVEHYLIDAGYADRDGKILVTRDGYVAAPDIDIED